MIPRQVWRFTSWCGIAGLSFVGLLRVSANLADGLGQGLGEGLVALTPLADPSWEEFPPERKGGVPSHETLPGSPATAATAPSARPSVTSPRSALARQPVGPLPKAVTNRPRTIVTHHGIRISADSVLRLARSGIQPTGVRVGSDGERPPGLLLSGVSALGVGLREGDILTHAGGRPALSRGDVVSMVLAARGRRLPEISGIFWRDGEPWNLTVEQPYLSPPERETPK